MKLELAEIKRQFQLDHKTIRKFLKLWHEKTHARHTTSTIRNKQEKLEGKGEASFDTPFMILQNHAENMKKILGGL